MLALTYPHRTAAHDIPAGWKLAGLAVISALLFIFATLWILIATLCAVIILHLALSPALLKHAIWMMKPIWIFVAIIAIFHIITGDVPAGILLILRIVTLVALANLVTMTTRLDDMIKVVETLCLPLRHFGLKPRIFGLAIALVVRFTPALIVTAQELRDSWKARSNRRAGWRLILPLCLSAIDQADQTAEALRARGGLGEETNGT